MLPFVCSNESSASCDPHTHTPLFLVFRLVRSFQHVSESNAGLHSTFSASPYDIPWRPNEVNSLIHIDTVRNVQRRPKCSFRQCFRDYLRHSTVYTPAVAKCTILLKIKKAHFVHTVYLFIPYLSPTALQPGLGLGVLQEFPPSFPV